VGKIRYFFWSTALSGILLIYGAMSGNLKKYMATVTAVRTQGASGLPSSIKEKLPLVFHEFLPTIVKRKIPCHVWDNVDALSDVNYYPDSAASACVEKDQPAVAEDGAPIEREAPAKNAAAPAIKRGPPMKIPGPNGVTTDAKLSKRLAASGDPTRDDIASGKYVQIEGKYYRKRSDNIYMIDGRQIYFVNNHRYLLTDEDAKSANRITTVSQGPTIEDPPQAEPQVAAQAPAPADRQVDASKDAEMPSSPAEMMKILQKAQVNQQAEQQMLKALEEEK